MRFKIISTGWNCLPFIEQTLRSIENQTLNNYDVLIVDDATEDPAQAAFIQKWCDERDERWNYRINPEPKYCVQNQVEAIELLDPEDDDVIVWLDLDGDQFAHPQVLERLIAAYSDGTLLTYGNYRPVPDPGTCPPCDPFPPHVIASHSFRSEVLSGFCHFNHLRTMKAKIFNAIPKEYFFFQGTDQWYESGTDYVIMVPGLELAGPRHKFIPEVLCLYNHGNPLAENQRRANFTTTAVLDALRRPALALLTEGEVRQSAYPVRDEHRDLFMPAEARRQLLMNAGGRYGLKYFIETGTCSGDTPLFLHNTFSVLHTIELDPHLFESARQRLAPYLNVRCWHGDSTSILPKVLQEIDGRALVWLDGHYSGPGTSRGELDTPVVAELFTLLADARRHVIFIDDARIFDGGPEHDLEPHYHDYPSLDWVRELAEANEYSYVLSDDIIRLCPKELQ